MNLKILILSSLIFIVNKVIAQSIPFEGHSLNSFIPNSWKLVDSVSTDFNKDGLVDIAMVIQSQKPKIQINNECGGSSEFYQKILLIAFRTQRGDLKLIENTQKIFGKCNWGLQGGDAFSDIDKRKNTLKIEFFTGGTLRIIPIYYFAYKKGKWVLVGYSKEEIEVPSNNIVFEDYNLITGIKEKYNIVNDKKSLISQSNSSFKPYIELKNFDATGGGVEGIGN